MSSAAAAALPCGGGEGGGEGGGGRGREGEGGRERGGEREGGGETHCQGYRTPEKSRYLAVVVENMCNGPWIYSARELIVEELRMDVPGPDDVWFIPVRRSAEVVL